MNESKRKIDRYKNFDYIQNMGVQKLGACLSTSNLIYSEIIEICHDGNASRNRKYCLRINLIRPSINKERQPFLDTKSFQQ